jgi:hypothetical protein
MRGWVVKCARHLPATEKLPRRLIVTYWYGPAEGFGTTSGALEHGARVWPTKAAAEQALRAIFSVPSVWQSRGYAPERVADAERRQAIRDEAGIGDPS